MSKPPAQSHSTSSNLEGRGKNRHHLTCRSHSLPLQKRRSLRVEKLISPKVDNVPQPIPNLDPEVIHALMSTSCLLPPVSIGYYSSSFSFYLNFQNYRSNLASCSFLISLLFSRTLLPPTPTHHAPKGGPPWPDGDLAHSCRFSLDTVSTAKTSE